jgi:GT2 family glycosyltransferase
MKYPSLAIIMTCHNRRDITLTCLEALYQQGISFDVYLTDDGSSDGTAEAIASCYPEVHLLKGSGNLYWGGGMRLAFAEAMKQGYGFYLWLNDDTILAPSALTHLLTLHQKLTRQKQECSIVVGATQDPITRKATYGGAIKSKSWYSNKFEFLEPIDSPQECDTFYGNCVLIPASVSQRIGNLDAAFIHSLGDLDYGLRARLSGCSIWVAPEFVGTCTRNSIRNSWADTHLSLPERLRKVTQVKGFPIKPWTVFCRRHSGSFWFIYWFLPYIRAAIGYKNLEASPAFCQNVELQ